MLVAKQAACLDVLCNGRLRLGVGTGWNQVEYESLNVSFNRRGEIFDDQIGALRELWTKPAVSLKTPYHTIVDAGINPLPVQRPIPLWFGGGSPSPFGVKPNIEKVTRRIARIADGWVPSFARLVRSDEGAKIVAYDDEGAKIVEQFRGYVREYGCDPAKIGLEGSVTTFPKTEAVTWVDTAKFWKKLGANYMSINTMLDGLRGCEGTSPPPGRSRNCDSRRNLKKRAKTRPIRCSWARNSGRQLEFRHVAVHNKCRSTRLRRFDQSLKDRPRLLASGRDRNTL